MKAVLLHAYGDTDQLHYEDVPDPIPAEGEILVRLAATSVNPIDWKMRNGSAAARFPIEFPAILGRDIAGIVRAIGPGVTGFSPGDKVIALSTRTYAELAVVKAADTAHIPEGLDVVEAAALPLVLLTGEQLITRGTKIQPGQTVLVTGAIGSVGRSAVFVAKKAGAKVIAGVRKSQLDKAADLKADQLIALDDDDALAKLGFLDAIADTVSGQIAEKLLAKVKQNGIFATVAALPENAALHPTVQVTRIVCTPDAATLRTLAEDIAAGRFKIPITRMMQLKEAAEAQTLAEKGAGGKILLLT
ncbi:MAG TPA: NADP-dependent oxidoreductase [Acidobacteriaceae bacterium]|nr:NADP-dependent oxidoreductase [Acidobacteriaceae bacterium]